MLLSRHTRLCAEIFARHNAMNPDSSLINRLRLYSQPASDFINPQAATAMTLTLNPEVRNNVSWSGKLAPKKYVDYSEDIVPLVEKLQFQQSEILDLKAANSKLAAQYDELKALVEPMVIWWEARMAWNNPTPVDDFDDKKAKVLNSQ